MEKSFIFVSIGDIHWGCKPPQDLYDELYDGFYKYIKKMSKINYVFICGDYFDTKISMNSEIAKYSLLFMSQLLELSIEKNFKIRIIKGTEYHDNKQLNIIQILNKENKYDLKVYQSVDCEINEDGLNILYIPEEYIETMDYYKDYFSNEYDIIIGHGLFQETSFSSTMQESAITMKKAPIFKSKKLMSICNGPIFFGHIHKHQIIHNKICYVGSYSRWIYGEEEDKGFIVSKYDKNIKSYSFDFIKNKNAPDYDTMIIDYNSNIYHYNEENLPNELLNLISIINNYKRLRIIFNIPENYENFQLFSNLVNDLFSKHKNIKIKINNNLKLKKKKEIDDKINILLEKYKTLFDKSIPVEEKLSDYLKIKYGLNKSIEEIREILYEKINIRGC